MRKGVMLSWALFASLLLNAALIIVLTYITCIMTDLSDRFMSKIGMGSYSVVDSRHHIEKRCIEGWNNTLDKMKINSDVVFYGNSITFASNFQTQFPHLSVCNLGCNRDDLDDLIYRSFLISSVHPKKIFVLGGINCLREISLQKFRMKYETLVDTIKKQNPYSELYVQSILPVNISMKIGSRYNGYKEKIKKVNAIIRDVSEKKKCVFVDLYSIYQVDDSLPQRYTPDGLHLYPDAYLKWGDYISSYLTE